MVSQSRNLSNHIWPHLSELIPDQWTKETIAWLHVSKPDMLISQIWGLSHLGPKGSYTTVHFITRVSITLLFTVVPCILPKAISPSPNCINLLQCRLVSSTSSPLGHQHVNDFQDFREESNQSLMNLSKCTKMISWMFFLKLYWNILLASLHSISFFHLIYF